MGQDADLWAERTWQDIDAEVASVQRENAQLRALLAVFEDLERETAAVLGDAQRIADAVRDRPESAPAMEG